MLVEKFVELINEDDSEATAKWLNKENNKFLAKQKQGDITEEYIEELSDLHELFVNIQSEAGGFPKAIADAIENSDWIDFLIQHFNQMRKQEEKEKKERLNDVEKETHAELLKMLWDIPERKRFSSFFYDYDDDADVEYELEIPRKISDEEREQFKLTLSANLSMLIWNRAPFVIEVALPRGRFDVYGITFDEKGNWWPIAPKEIKERFIDNLNTDKYFGLEDKINYKQFFKQKKADIFKLKTRD